MNESKLFNSPLSKLVGTYWQWRFLWVGSTVVFAALGLFYVLFLKNDKWMASQGLIIRDEANGAVMRLGRFESQTQMRAAQETVLEMAHNQQVLFEALKEVGREPGYFTWFTSTGDPSNAEIIGLAKNGVEVRAPRGAELGTTEVIYLDVIQSSRARALELNKAVCDALERRLKQVRQARANGVISELLAAKQAATKNLMAATENLRRMEGEAGADLSDLRGMTEPTSGGSSARANLDQVKDELRKAELEHEQIKIDLDMAQESFDDPTQLLVTPTAIVNSQPGLKRLREGLSAASITSSELRGRYTTEHPLVVASTQTELRIREQLRSELAVAVETLNKDLELAASKVAKLTAQKLSLEGRITRLSQVRAGYANVASEVKARNDQLQEAERELAQAEAARDAALTSSLLTRLDKPAIGENPIGPGRSTILAGSTVCGLMFGFGVVFLLSPLGGEVNFGRRQFDYSGRAGRRAADHTSSTPKNADRGASVDHSVQSPGQSFAEEANGLPENLLSTGRAATISEMIEAEKKAAFAARTRRQPTAEPTDNATPTTSPTVQVPNPAPQPLNESLPYPSAPASKPTTAPTQSAVAPQASLPTSVTASSAASSKAAEIKQPAHTPPTAAQATQSDEQSLAAAQAVIAAALQCSASAAPTSGEKPKG